jgi:hypothetical protein
MRNRCVVARVNGSMKMRRKMIPHGVRRLIPRRKESGRPADSYKDYLAVVPLLLTSGALTFDVGYFAGVDINFFTLFSLSEHVLFALEALPLVFVIIFISVYLAYIWLGLTKRLSGEWLSSIRSQTSSPYVVALRSLIGGLLTLVIVLLVSVKTFASLAGIILCGFLATLVLAPRLFADRTARLILSSVAALFFSLLSWCVGGSRLRSGR